MIQLTTAFLKIFFRNKRAMFFVLLLPAGIFLIAAYLGLEEIIRFEAGIPYLDFLLAGIVALALMQSGIYTVAYNLVDYRRTGVIKRLFAAPLSPAQFLWAQNFSRFVIAILQTVVLVAVGVFLFGINLKSSILFLPMVIFLGSTLFLQMGFIIAAIARDYEEAAPYTSIIGISLTFLGDVFFPIGNLPHTLEQVARFSPLAKLSSLMRFSLMGTASDNLGQDFLIVFTWLAGLVLLAQTIFSRKTES